MLFDLGSRAALPDHIQVACCCGRRVYIVCPW